MGSNNLDSLKEVSSILLQVMLLDSVPEMPDQPVHQVAELESHQPPMVDPPLVVVPVVVWPTNLVTSRLVVTDRARSVATMLVRSSLDKIPGSNSQDSTPDSSNLGSIMGSNNLDSLKVVSLILPLAMLPDSVLEMPDQLVHRVVEWESHRPPTADPPLVVEVVVVRVTSSVISKLVVMDRARSVVPMLVQSSLVKIPGSNSQDSTPGSNNQDSTPDSSNLDSIMGSNNLDSLKEVSSILLQVMLLDSVPEMPDQPVHQVAEWESHQLPTADPPLEVVLVVVWPTNLVTSRQVVMGRARLVVTMLVRSSLDKTPASNSQDSTLDSSNLGSIMGSSNLVSLKVVSSIPLPEMLLDSVPEMPDPTEFRPPELLLLAPTTAALLRPPVPELLPPILWVTKMPKDQETAKVSANK